MIKNEVFYNIEDFVEYFINDYKNDNYYPQILKEVLDKNEIHNKWWTLMQNWWHSHYEPFNSKLEKELIKDIKKYVIKELNNKINFPIQYTCDYDYKTNSLDTHCCYYIIKLEQVKQITFKELLDK